jgi:hypothetical protein
VIARTRLAFGGSLLIAVLVVANLIGGPMNQLFLMFLALIKRCISAFTSFCSSSCGRWPSVDS